MVHRLLFHVVVALFAIVSLPGESFCSDAPGIGPDAKWFITKIYPGHGALSEADFRQLADAGFTGIANRWTFDHDGEPVIERYVRGASEVGLDTAAWRGGMARATAPDDQVMTYEGKTTKYTRPYSAEGWQQIIDETVKLAELSLQYPNLKASFLDFEIYDKNKTDGFAESYDDVSFSRFLELHGAAMAHIEPTERQAWLEQHDRLSAYIDWQAKLVGEQAQRLRTAVDAVNPRFQIGVYGWGAMIDAVKENVATETAPMVDLDAWPYGRSVWNKELYERGYDANRPDREGLKWSLLRVADDVAKARQRSYPNVFLGGHYPQSAGPADGTQFEFTVRQAFNSVAYADGYWIWTDWKPSEGWAGTKQDWIDAMMQRFHDAHVALDQKDYTWSYRQPLQIESPHATTPQLLLTRDVDQKVQTWNPLLGDVAAKQVTDVPVRWGTAIEADVDGLSGLERVYLRDGWIEVEDPETRIVLLRFHAGENCKYIGVASNQ